MFREEKNTEQPKTQAAPMKPMSSQPGMAPYTGHPGMSNPMYPPMPGTQPGYYPGTPYPGMELAKIYFPIQRWGPVFDYAQALQAGTIFPELYRPYPY